MKRSIITIIIAFITILCYGQAIGIHCWTKNYYWTKNIDHLEFSPDFISFISSSQDIPGYLMQDVDSITFHSIDEMPYFIYDPSYQSSDYSKDGQIVRLQTHTKGKGIPLVILGAGFSDRMIDLNLYNQSAYSAMEAFFAKEPFTTYRRYFDVYSITIVSKKEVPNNDGPFSLWDDNDKRLPNYILNINELNGSLENVTVILIENLSAGYSGSYYTLTDAFGINNFNIGQTYVEWSELYFHFNTFLVEHEVGGHAFGLLEDERVYDNATDVFPNNDKLWLDSQHSKGASMNIDYHSTPETVLWKDFMSNLNYEVEGIGLYEGGLYTIAKGIYRPSDTSIMYDSDGKDYFNAPSRWAIYQRIMKLAGEECTFENFLEYDKKNLEAIKAKSQKLEVRKASSFRHEDLHKSCVITTRR